MPCPKRQAHRRVERCKDFEEAVQKAELLPQVGEGKEFCSGMTLESEGYTLRVSADLRNASLNAVTTSLASWLRLPAPTAPTEAS